MDYLVLSLGALALSMVANLWLAYRHFIKKSNVLTVDAKKLLNDLMGSGATVRIQVLDSGSLMYRSPRG